MVGRHAKLTMESGQESRLENRYHKGRTSSKCEVLKATSTKAERALAGVMLTVYAAINLFVC